MGTLLMNAVAKTFEQTIHLAKYVRKHSFKKRSPIGIKYIKQLGLKLTRCSEATITPALNKFIWAHGIRNPPSRVRVSFKTTRSSKDDNKDICECDLVAVESFTGLQNVSIEN